MTAIAVGDIGSFLSDWKQSVTLQDFGDIGSFIGGIGVIFSLLYLARQIRDSSRIDRLNARYAVGQALLNVFNRIDDDPELNRVWVAANSGDENLSTQDQERLGRYLFRYFATMGMAYGFAEIDPEIKGRSELLLTRLFEVVTVRKWWQRHRTLYAESFRVEVDRLVDSLESQ